MIIKISIAILGWAIAILGLKNIKNKETKKTVILIGILSTLFLIATIWNDFNNERKEESNSLNSNKFQETILNKLDSKNDPYHENNQGFSFYLALSTNEIVELRRKFIFDFGESENSNRISLYFDSENNLIFRIIDKNGEFNICKVPSNSYNFYPNTPFFIYCDCGFSPSYSFMRLRINDRELYRSGGSSKIEFISSKFLDTNKLSFFSMVRKKDTSEFYRTKNKYFRDEFEGAFASDLKGNYNSSFYPLEFVIFGGNLPEQKINLLWDNVKSNVFPYESFMRKYLRPFNSYYRIVNDKIELVKQ